MCKFEASVHTGRAICNHAQFKYTRSRLSLSQLGLCYCIVKRDDVMNLTMLVMIETTVKLRMVLHTGHHVKCKTVVSSA